MFLVVLHHRLKRKTSERAQAVAADGRTEPLIAEFIELCPQWCARNMLQSEEPVMCDARQMIRGEPHLVGFNGALSFEELLAPHQPPEQIFFPVGRACGSREQ